MPNPKAYKLTGLARVTIEVIAIDDDSARAQFESADLSDFELLDMDLIEFEELGEHYAN